MFETVAAGFIADELSRPMAEAFLKSISKDYNDVYGIEESKKEQDDFAGGPPKYIDKKRSLADAQDQPQNTVKPNAKNMKKSQTTAAAVGGFGALDKFFKPK